MNRASDIEEFKGWNDPPVMSAATVKKAIRQAWKRKFGSVCQMCGTLMHFDIKARGHKHYATIDHILARALGGTDHLHNVQVVCKTCNNKKSVSEGYKSLD